MVCVKTLYDYKVQSKKDKKPENECSIQRINKTTYYTETFIMQLMQIHIINLYTCKCIYKFNMNSEVICTQQLIVHCV